MRGCRRSRRPRDDELRVLRRHRPVTKRRLASVAGAPRDGVNLDVKFARRLATESCAPQVRGIGCRRLEAELWCLFRSVRAGALALVFCSVPALAHAETLREALTSAYLNNPTILSALLNVKATAENIALAKSAKLPTIGASASVSGRLTIGGRCRSSRRPVTVGASYSQTHLRQFQERRRHRGGARADRGQPLLRCRTPSRTCCSRWCRPISGVIQDTAAGAAAPGEREVLPGAGRSARTTG